MQSRIAIIYVVLSSLTEQFQFSDSSPPFSAPAPFPPFPLFATCQAGFILSCVGSVRDVSLRLAGAERPSLPSSASQACAVGRPQGYSDPQQDQGQEQEQRKQEGEEKHMLHTGADARFEVLSLVGTLSPGGLHLHASLGDERGAMCGGHLVRATVHTTAEIVVGVAHSLAFSREMDPGTGFKELVVSGSAESGSSFVRVYWCLFVAVMALVMVGGAVSLAALG